ncbi:MAG: LysR family transcriptional regulator substrate-binding protein [Thermoanaerobaculia bacterium]
MLESTCYRWLPPLLKPFHKRFPRVDVEIVPDVTRRTLEALHERKIDLALVYSTRRDPRLRIVPVFEDEMVVIVARDHRLAKKSHVVASDLAGEGGSSASSAPARSWRIPRRAPSMLPMMTRTQAANPGEPAQWHPQRSREWREPRLRRPHRRGTARGDAATTGHALIGYNSRLSPGWNIPSPRVRPTPCI